MATITPHLRTGKERDGSSPIYIRVSHKGKECFVTLGIKASERDWNRRQLRLRKSYAGFFEANRRIEEVASELEAIAQRLVLSGEPFSARDVKERYLGKRSAAGLATDQGFLAFAWQRHGLIERFNTRRNHATSLRAFQSFLRGDRGKDDIAASEVTAALLGRFKAYCSAVLGIAPSTLHKCGSCGSITEIRCGKDSSLRRCRTRSPASCRSKAPPSRKP